MRCPYCYNKELATANAATGPDTHTAQEYFSLENIFAHLERRAKVLGGLAISGGEPLLSPALEPLIRKAKGLGLAVKIDTNGTLPDKLASLIDDETVRPDMIALDVKTTPGKYSLLFPTGGASAETAQYAGEQVLRTLDILRTVAANTRIKVEYRTVLVPGLVTERDVEELSRLLPANADWKFAGFVPGGCINPEWDALPPYTREETDRIVTTARKHIPAAELR